jgi:hypothetical protein
MKIVPYIFILVGGIMIYAGIKGDNPVSVLKSVLQNGSTPSATPVSNTTPSPTIAPANPPGLFGQVIQNAGN